jgi:hypothetical protein
MYRTNLCDYHHHVTKTGHSIHHRGYIESFLVKTNGQQGSSVDLKWRRSKAAPIGLNDENHRAHGTQTEEVLQTGHPGRR